MKKFWIVFLILVVVVMGGMALLWRAADRFAAAPPVRGGVLVWTARNEISEVRDDSFAGLLRHGRPLVFRDIVLALERAATDSRIRGLLLDLRGLDVDWAKIDELREQVLRFREQGKPVLAVLAMASTKEYVLATAADRVALAPEGALLVFGVAAELLFFRDTLAKVGIEADFLHVGRYKSAPEQLTRAEPTDANREMMEAIVGERYRRLVETIAAARAVAPETVRAWIDDGLFDAPTALAEGLVDTVAHADDLRREFLSGEDVTELIAYVRERPRGRRAGTVALVTVGGTIMPGESHKDPWQGWVAGAQTVCERLEAAAEDDDVAAIVLRVDSPGGSALASDTIANAMVRAREKKPVVVSMSGYAASGGYYVSCGADSIFAQPGTLTGSIGVFAGKLDMSGLYTKLDVNRAVIAGGKNAEFFSSHGGFTAEQRRRFQAHLERFYQRFLTRVADARGLEREAVAAVAEGRVWTGEQAVQRGLVDQLGGLTRALLAARRLGGLPAEDRLAVQVYERHLSWLERLLLGAVGDVPGGGLPIEAAAGVWLGPLASAGQRLAAGGATALPDLLDGQPVALPPYYLIVH